MPIKKDDSGRRSVQVEVEVPGSPETVWRAIASGPGIASWFVPTTFETDDSGKPVRVISNFGPGMESVAEVTDWQPPHRMAADSADLGPDAPKIATEWIVEAKDGGTCTVRVVHSLFTSADDWDNQLEGWESGWPDFFRILRLYLTHFPNQECAPFQLQATTTETPEDAWAKLSEAFGSVGTTVGASLESAAGAPPVRALVECVGSPGHPAELLFRQEHPSPGLAHLFAMSMGGQTLVSVRVLNYGESAQTAAEEQEPTWKAWLDGLFPPAG